MRNVAVVAGGTAAAQAIAVAFSPVITRLYGPEAFGVLGVFVAAVAIVQPVANLAYAHAIVLPPSDAQAYALVRLSLRIAIGVAIIAAFVFGVWHRQIAHALGFDAAAPFLLIVPLVLLLVGTENVLRQWLIRTKRFRAISEVSVAQSAATGASKSAVGLVAATAPVLIVLNALGHALLTSMLWLKARPTLSAAREAQESSRRELRGYSLRETAVAYRDFPLFRAPQILLNSVSSNLPVLLLAGTFGPAPAGFLALGRRVLSLPSALISQSVGTVFLPRIAEAGHRSEPLRPLIIRGTGALALAGLLPFGLVIAAGPWLFGFVFGSEWVAAGEYARWLALWLYFAFINVPSVQAIPLLGLQAHFLVYEVISVSIRAGSLLFGAHVIGSDVGAIALFSVAGAVLNGVLIAWVLMRSDGALRDNLSGGADVPTADEFNASESEL